MNTRKAIIIEVTAANIRALTKRRLKAAKDFYLKLQAIEDDEESLALELLKRAPTSWLRFLTDVNVIGGLTLAGHSEYLFEFGRYGFTDKTDVARKVTAINEAWDAIVKVTANFDKSGKNQIYLNFLLCE